MANVSASWALPTVGANQRPIKHVIVELSADGGANFSLVQNVLATVSQQVSVSDVEPGSYQFRHTVEDISGAKGSPVVTPFTVVAVQPPGSVANVQVQVAV